MRKVRISDEGCNMKPINITKYRRRKKGRENERRVEGNSEVNRDARCQTGAKIYIYIHRCKPYGLVYRSFSKVR